MYAALASGYTVVMIQTATVSTPIIPQQLVLRPPLPRVVGTVEYELFCAYWHRVDALLSAGVESDFVARSVRHHEVTRQRPMTHSEQAAFQQESRKALRCTVARQLLGESFRAFSRHLGESSVLQQFCLLGDLEAVVIPGHSQLQRYDGWLPEVDLSAVVRGQVTQAAAPEASTTLGLKSPVSLETVWVDSTCAETNIHYPVDWVLLRDAVRTLIQAIQVLRAHELKHRMPDPASFPAAMNKLCMRMTHAGKGEKGKRRRKAIVREMLALVQTVRDHAERYSALVDAMETRAGWADAARRRMRAVFDQLPTVLHQVRERMLGERLVPTAEKVLSLYEPDTAVLTRGKAGAQVEFGHSLFIAEQREGLIVDWALPQRPQDDQTLLAASVTRCLESYGRDTIRVSVGDRGFAGPCARMALDSAGIRDGACPRSPRQLAVRLEDDPDFRPQQRRRSQTEGRIAIVKQTFLGGYLHTKGHAHHALEIAWVVLTHNLWVLARLPVADERLLAA